MTDQTAFPVLKNEEDAINALMALVDGKSIEIDLNSEEFKKSFDWAQVTVYISHPSKDGSITPPMMEAYIRLQKSIYQTVALAKYGQAQVQKLTEEDKAKYQINVEVKKGSSDQSVDLTKILIDLAHDLAGKMTPEQIFHLVLYAGILYAGHSAWRHFLNYRKEIRLAEIQSDERKKTLEAFHASGVEETKRLETILSLSSDRVDFGHELRKRAEITNEAMLKAAANTDDAKIQGIDVPTSVAKELRSSQRRTASIYVVEKEMRVVDVNTQNDLKITAFLEDSETLDIEKIEFKDAILAEAARQALFAALEERKPALIRMKVKDLDGDITPIEILHVSLVEAETSTPPQDRLASEE